MFIIHERTNPRAFDRDKRRNCLQSFRNTANAWSSVEVKKPILPARRARAPQRAPRPRDVNAYAGAVTEQGNVRQPGNQLRARHLPFAAGHALQFSARFRFPVPVAANRPNQVTATSCSTAMRRRVVSRLMRD